MSAIQEALHQLRSIKEDDEMKVTSRAFKDLWDQVYCSITDGGANSAYAALGKYNGKNHYPIQRVEAGKVEGENYTLTIRTKNPSWAKTIADLYDLKYKEYPGKITLYIPRYGKIRQDIIDKYGTKLNKDVDDETIDESLETSFPVTILPKSELKEYIENIPVATQTEPPRFFKLGYVRELKSEIKASFRNGLGTEDSPKVRILKCSEYSRLYTGADYENLKATKDMRKVTGKERSGERTGFSYNSDLAVPEKIGISSSGEEQLQCYMNKNNTTKVKYFISINGSDFTEASLNDILTYLTPASASRLTTKSEVENPAAEGAKVLRLKLSGIYMIGTLGKSVF